MISSIMSNLSNFQRETRQKKEKWRLFHAKDFQSLMYPCFTMCRILGIFPYKMNDSTFKVSKLFYILSIVIICVYNIHALMTMYDIFTTKMDIKIFPITLLTVCALIATDFIIIVTLILTGSRARLLQAILKISSKLPAESYQKLSRLIHAKDIIGFLYIIWVMLKYLPLQKNILFYIYIYLVVLQMDMLYMNCVCILKACFKEINDNLTNIRKLIITNNESHSPRVIYHEQRNPFLIMELKELKKQHLTISDTIQTLNMIFSLQLLATVVMTFSTITGCLYYYILNWEYILTHTSASESYHVTYLSHIMHIFIKIVLIVWACETGKDQAQQISTSIHDVFNSTTNEQIREELQLFSLQILHCDNTFSAKGFTVDAKLLAWIISSIVTHLIISFQIKWASCEKVANNMMEVI